MKPTEINVDRSGDLLADQFEIAAAGSEGFTAQPLGSEARIDSGLLDADLVAKLGTAISSGITDEVELHVTPSQITSVVRGKNAMALGVMNTSAYFVFVTTLPSIPGGPKPFPNGPPLGTTYVPAPTQAGTSKGPPEGGSSTINGGQIPGAPMRLYGEWKASEIAQRCAATVYVAWGVPDYTLREDFTATGSLIDIIQQLCAPFSRFEPFKIDITTTSSRHAQTLNVKFRAPSDSVTIDVRDANITDLKIRARRLGFINYVRVNGTKYGPYTGGGNIFIDPGDADSSDTDTMTLNGVTTTVATQTSTRILDGAVKSRVVNTTIFNPNADPQVSWTIEAMTSDWEDIQFSSLPEDIGKGVILNKPKEKSRSIEVTTSTAARSSTTLVNAYDVNGYLRTCTTTKAVYSEDGVKTIDSIETKTYRRNGMRLYEITTTQFDSVSEFSSVRRTTANGTPPGGPGRGGGAGAAQSRPIVPVYAARAISGMGKDIMLSGNTMYYSGIYDAVCGLAAASSGATEVMFSFTAANMPWLKQGQGIILTGLQDEYGGALRLDVGTVTEAKFEYRESSSNPTSLVHVQGVYYTREITTSSPVALPAAPAALPPASPPPVPLQEPVPVLYSGLTFGGMATSFSAIMQLTQHEWPGVFYLSDITGGAGPEGSEPMGIGVNEAYFFIGLASNEHTVWAPQSHYHGTVQPSGAQILAALATVGGIRYIGLGSVDPNAPFPIYEAGSVDGPSPGPRYVRVGTSGAGGIPEYSLGEGFPIYAREGTDQSLIDFAISLTDGVGV
jgi:hypothetical protein